MESRQELTQNRSHSSSPKSTKSAVADQECVSTRKVTFKALRVINDVLSSRYYIYTEIFGEMID